MLFRSYTVALKNDGTVVAWGNNGNSQTAVPAGLSGVVAIGAGGGHTVALVAPPTLTIQRTNNNLILSWPGASAAGFALHGNADMKLTNSWSAVGQSVVSNLGTNSVTLPLTSTNQFFRLKKP